MHTNPVTTHTGGVDWNRILQRCGTIMFKSPPTRVVWIEIMLRITLSLTPIVTTHTGGVDWNIFFEKETDPVTYVTTHTGGVDWNRHKLPDWGPFYSHHPHGWCGLKSRRLQQQVARNWVTTHTGGVDWNFSNCCNSLVCLSVTTHTGGVDWNCCGFYNLIHSFGHHPHGWCGLKFVCFLQLFVKECHHPHGWCGLKS